MHLAIKCHSNTTFGIYVNGEWQTNYTTTVAFEPHTYVVISPPSKDGIEFLNVEHRCDHQIMYSCKSNHKR
jgi:hypothetical protein